MFKSLLSLRLLIKWANNGDGVKETNFLLTTEKNITPIGQLDETPSSSIQLNKTRRIRYRNSFGWWSSSSSSVRSHRLRRLPRNKALLISADLCYLSVWVNLLIIVSSFRVPMSFSMWIETEKSHVIDLNRKRIRLPLFIFNPLKKRTRHLPVEWSAVSSYFNRTHSPRSGAERRLIFSFRRDWVADDDKVWSHCHCNWKRTEWER